MAEISFHHGPEASKRRKLEHPFYNNYGYEYSRAVKDTIYVVCIEKRRKSCKGTGKIINKIFTPLQEHNHDPDPAVEKIYNFEKKLYDETLKQPFKLLRLIYQDVSAEHREAAVHKSWRSMESRMQEWRKVTQPPLPTTLLHYNEILRDPQWEFYLKNNEDRRLHVVTLQATDESYVTVYGDITFLRSIETTDLFIDATFQIVPKQPKVHQLLTIVALVYDTAIPVCWCLMERKTTAAYLAVLAYFSRIFTPQLNLRSIMTDFEAALSLAINIIYPEVSHKRCYFHYCQAIIKKIKRLGLLRITKDWNMGRIIIRKYLALPLLPPQDIVNAFNWLVASLPEVIRVVFNKFIAYYERQWIRRIRPERLSVFGYLHRTNNFSEAYNRVLNQEIGIHPTIWKLTYHINRLAQNSVLEYRSLQSGNETRRPTRRSDAIKNETIQKSWNYYVLGLINLPQFLSCASHFLNAFTNTVINDDVEPIAIIEQNENYNQVHSLRQIEMDFQHSEIFNEIDINEMNFIIFMNDE